MAPASVAVKRSIAVRKIAPRKTVAPSEHDKENTPRRSVLESGPQKKPQVSTPAPVARRGGDTSAAQKKKKKQEEEEEEEEEEEAAGLSPILRSSPPAPSLPKQPAVDAEDAVWSQKVRRSYSRLGDKSSSPGDKSFSPGDKSFSPGDKSSSPGDKSSSPGDKSFSPGDKSFSGPDCRGNMFGFDTLQTPEVGPRVLRSRTGPEVPCAPSAALNPFTSLLEAEEAAGLEPDLHIPGVLLQKEKRTRRKKVQQIGTTELDALAARLNAEFEEAEEFELLVE